MVCTALAKRVKLGAHNHGLLQQIVTPFANQLVGRRLNEQSRVISWHGYLLIEDDYVCGN
jgi:hypothetical protein